MFGKHASEDYTNRQLRKVIERRNREIEDIKTECANEFKKIAELCFCNTYDEMLNEHKKLSVIEEIAQFNYLALSTDLVLDKELKAKIIELTQREL